VRIALTADPEIPVPPRLYGGIERIVDLLARGLLAAGHEVTLFAHRESATEGRFVPWPGKSSRAPVDTVRNALALTRAVAASDFDLVHSFSRIAYLTPILPLSIPKLMTYQREISPRSVRLGHLLSRGTLQFSAISDWMMRDVAHLAHWSMVPNGVSLETYEYRATVAADAPLVFLGRLEEIKGPHLAIEIAQRTGSALVLAGNIPDAHQAWFDAKVKPHLDGDQIRYVGPVDDAQKNQLLGAASAFLMPILWEEPFGIVMAEAMACGTPVVGFRRGAVPEVVEDGVSGFVVDDLEQMVFAAGRVSTLSRQACRARVEALYSTRAITDGYLDVYSQMLASSGRTAA
jgi:glycosyltransferase involved in cell wall biosynthesis